MSKESAAKRVTSKSTSPRGVQFVNFDDSKSEPNPEGRTALVAISVGAKYHEGEHLQGILREVKDAGYKKAKVLVGGLLQWRNYLSKLAMKQAQAVEKETAESKNGGKNIWELDASELEALDKQLEEIAKQSAREEELKWLERNEKYIVELQQAGVHVEILGWEDQLKRDQFQQNALLVSAELSKKNGLKKYVRQAKDEMHVLHVAECQLENYTDALDTHKKFFIRKNKHYIIEEDTVLIDDQFKGCDFVYPMQNSKVSKHVVNGLKKLIEGQKPDLDLRFYSANFSNNKKKVSLQRASDEKTEDASETFTRKPSEDSASRLAASVGMHRSANVTIRRPNVDGGNLVKRRSSDDMSLGSTSDGTPPLTDDAIGNAWMADAALKAPVSDSAWKIATAQQYIAKILSATQSVQVQHGPK